MVEYRNRSFPPPPAPADDAGALDDGVAVWYVKTDSTGKLKEIGWSSGPAPLGTGGSTYADYLVGPSREGAGPLWKSSDGEFGLDWPDGTDSGLRLTVGRISPGEPRTAIQWRHREAPFTPRVDAVEPGTAGPMQTVVCEGMFPVDPAQISVTMERIGSGGFGPGAYDLRVERSSLTRVVAVVPDGVPAGKYGLRAVSQGARSNAAWLVIG